MSTPAMHVPDGRHWRKRLLTLGAVSSLVCARSAIVATFGLGLCFAVFNAYRSLAASNPSGIEGLIGLSMILLAAAFVALAIHLARRDSPLPARWFVPVALLAALAIRLAYYAMVDPAWVSDFATYWKIANELAGADHYQVVNLYQQRAMPYLVPIVEMFGNSPNGVKLANIAVLCLIQLLGYDVLRRCHGHAAAQCFTVLWIGAPEPLYSTLIPSHDLVAMGQVAIVLWLTVLAITRKRAAAGLLGARFMLYALPIAIMLAALEVERGIGRILLAALLLVGIAGLLIKSRFPPLIAGDPGQPKRLLLVALLSLPLYAGCMQGLASSHFSASDKVATAAMLRYTTAHATSLSNGSYKWMRAFHDTFTVAYAHDNARFADLRKSLVLSDFAESPLQRTDNAVTRLGDLYRLGGSIGFYSAGVAKHSPHIVPAMFVYNAAFALLLAVSALYGLLRLLVRPRFPLVIGVLLVLVALMTLILVLVAENQSRYIYTAWFVAAATVALGIARPPQDATDAVITDAPATPPWAMGWMVLQSFLAVFCIGAAAWIALGLAYDAESGRILSHWSVTADPPIATAAGTDWASDLEHAQSNVLWAVDKRYRVALKDFGPLALTLQLPKVPAIDDRVVARSKVCADGGARNDLAFFVYTPYKNLKRSGSFELEVAVDGHPRWRLALPHADKPTAIEIPDLIPANACSELAFTLRSKVDIPRESWRRASRVEIYFPRLVDTVR
jgi:hypothetical protein